MTSTIVEDLGYDHLEGYWSHEIHFLRRALYVSPTGKICQLNNVLAICIWDPYHSLLFFGARNSMSNSMSVSMSQKDSGSCGGGCSQNIYVQSFVFYSFQSTPVSNVSNYSLTLQFVEQTCYQLHFILYNKKTAAFNQPAWPR